MSMSAPSISSAAPAAFRETQNELEESALIDGATRWQAFCYVALPIARPGVAVAFISIITPIGMPMVVPIASRQIFCLAQFQDAVTLREQTVARHRSM
jgi:ABC-type maltose transport system permease subunit